MVLGGSPPSNLVASGRSENLRGAQRLSPLHISPDTGLSFEVPKGWLAEYDEGHLVVAPEGMDRKAPDHAFLVVNDYSSIFASGDSSIQVLQNAAFEGCKSDLRTWAEAMESRFAVVDPDRTFDLVGTSKRQIAMDQSTVDGDLHTTGYVVRDHRPLGVTLVGSGRYALLPNSRQLEFESALDQVAGSLTVSSEAMSSFRSSLGLPEASALAASTRRLDYWSLCSPRACGIRLSRSVDYGRPTMTRNAHDLRSDSSYQFRVTLVRAMVTDTPNTCAPEYGTTYWIKQWNYAAWSGAPVYAVWQGSFSNWSVGGQTCFWTFLEQLGAWYCLNHWYPFY